SKRHGFQAWIAPCSLPSEADRAGRGAAAGAIGDTLAAWPAMYAMSRRRRKNSSPKSRRSARAQGGELCGADPNPQIGGVGGGEPGRAARDSGGEIATHLHREPSKV